MITLMTTVLLLAGGKRERHLQSSLKSIRTLLFPLLRNIDIMHQSHAKILALARRPHEQVTPGTRARPQYSLLVFVTYLDCLQFGVGSYSVLITHDSSLSFAGF